MEHMSVDVYSSLSVPTVKDRLKHVANPLSQSWGWVNPYLCISNGPPYLSGLFQTWSAKKSLVLLLKHCEMIKYVIPSTEPQNAPLLVNSIYVQYKVTTRNTIYSEKKTHMVKLGMVS